MKLFEETTIHRITEIWFQWIEWLLVCAALNVFAIKTESNISWILFFISSGLCAYTIGHTAIDIGFHGLNKSHPKIVKAALILLMLSMPILLVIVLHNLIDMVLKNG